VYYRLLNANVVLQHETVLAATDGINLIKVETIPIHWPVAVYRKSIY